MGYKFQSENLPSPPEAAPDVIDYRKLQSPVRNQGDRPTCVGFAVSAAHEWLARDEVTRSPEDVIWAGHTQGGPAKKPETSVRFALAGLQAHGTPARRRGPTAVHHGPLSGLMQPHDQRTCERFRHGVSLRTPVWIPYGSHYRGDMQCWSPYESSRPCGVLQEA
jgi:hypothetical protein